VHAAGADDQQPLRAQVDGRRQRRGLPHRAVAVPGDVAALGICAAGKTNGIADDASRCSCVIGERTATRCERGPGLHRRAGAVEGDVLARGVARRRDRQRVQLALLEHHRQPVQRHHALQQVASGALSSSDRGRALRQRAITQPSDSIVSHCAPLRITPSESAR
jgi:hypothetical protein